MELKNLKVNFIGDSITEGVGASSYETCYVSRFAAMTGAICRNYGISGTRIARRKVPYEIPEFDRDFNSRYHLMEEDADVIVVFGGTNDYGHGDAPIGEMSDRTVWTFYGALHCLYTGILERWPESTIVIMTPLHREWEDLDTPHLQPFVDAIREVAEFYSLPVLDLWATSGLQPRVPIIKEKYFADHVHPADAGHQVIANKLKRFLENM
jgi:lysophospholipase L1-like esterase